MKSHKLLFICGLFFCTNLFSQIDHNFFIGSNLAGALNTISINRRVKENNSGFCTGFFGGYYFKRLSIGIGSDIMQQSNEYTDQLILKKNYIAFYCYPFIRYYFKRGLFIHTQFNFGFSDLATTYTPQMNPKYGNPEILAPYLIAGYTFCIGYSFKIKERLLIEPMMKSIFIHNFANPDGATNYDCGFGYYFCLDFIYAFKK
jgi:hypothetical protein